MKKTLSVALSLCLLLASLGTTACSDKTTNTVVDENVLRVASWDEYIDMGGDFLDPEEEAEYIAWYKDLTGINLLDTKPLYEEFEDDDDLDMPDGYGDGVDSFDDFDEMGGDF